MLLEDVFNFLSDLLYGFLAVGQFLTSELELINMTPLELFLSAGLITIVLFHLFKLGFSW